MTRHLLAAMTVVQLISIAPSAAFTDPSTGHEYSITPSTSSWFDAQAYAVSIGGNLAAITSQEEQDWIIANIPLPLVGSAGGFGPGVWIGGSDAILEADWQWVTGEPWEYTNWNPTEPNNDPVGGPGGEDYLVMWTDEVQLGKWNDADATQFGSNPLLLYGLVEVVPEPHTLGLLTGFCLLRRCRAGESIGRA